MVSISIVQIQAGPSRYKYMLQSVQGHVIVHGSSIGLCIKYMHMHSVERKVMHLQSMVQTSFQLCMCIRSLFKFLRICFPVSSTAQSNVYIVTPRTCARVK